MTEKQKQAMMNEPIYNTENDIVNLFNHEYNIGGNSKLDEYVEILKSILHPSTYQ
jgi:hypothetical protein